jgi:ATP-binding cassette subfamily F protein 3
MLLISANNIAVDYGGRTIFSDVSLDITSGERIGLVGENGAGKSTLLRVLAGQERPDEGSVVYSKGLRLGYLVQEPHFAPDVTVYDAVAGAHEEVAALGVRLAAIETAMAAPDAATTPQLDALLEEYGAAQHRYEELGGYAHAARVRRVLEGLGLGGETLGQPAEQLSGGQKKLVGLARLLVTEPDVLLLDEPDNHLDFEGKTFLEEYIREYPGAVVVISHDRYLLDRVVQRIVEIEDGAVTSWTGGYTSFVEQKDAHLLRQRALYRIQQDELRRQEEAMHRLVQWARQNPKFAGRAENMKKQVARKREEMMDRPILVRRRIRLDFGQHEGSRKVVTAHDLTLRAGPADGDGRPLLDDVAFAVAFGERVGIVGPNGSGKSTLLRAIAGLVVPTDGELRLGLTVRVGYYAQEQETLPPDQTPLAWIRQQHALTEQAGITRLRHLLLTYEDMHAPIGRLSGGQKSRLQFERLMLGDYNLLVLDEPTNNIDIASAEVLESALQTFQGTAIIVSHDRYLLDNAVDRILELPGDGTLHDFPGNYAYYLMHKPARQANTESAIVATARPSAALARAPSAGLHVDLAVHSSRVGAPEQTAPGGSAQSPSASSPPTSAGKGVGGKSRTAVRHVRVALLGVPGAGKRTLLAELAALSGAETTTAHEPTVSVLLADGLAADVGSATYESAAAQFATPTLAEVARRADALLLVQDLADTSLNQVAGLREALAADDIYAVPEPLAVTIRTRGKGGLNFAGAADPGVRDALLRWCRARQIAHAEVTVRCHITAAEVPLYAAAAWRRSGSRARSSPTPDDLASASFRPALIVGTRYDEYEPSAPDPVTAEERLRVAVPCFGCVAVSVLDPASLERLCAALATLLAG